MNIYLEQNNDNKTNKLVVKETDDGLNISTTTFSVIGGCRSGEYILDVNDAMKLKDALTCFINNSKK